MEGLGSGEIVRVLTTWLVLNAIAHNLGVWLGRLARLARPDQPAVRMRSLRYRFLCLPGRLTHFARRWTLHLPSRLPWRDAFLASLQASRVLRRLWLADHL